jgi:hypothetical protein
MHELIQVLYRQFPPGLKPSLDDLAYVGDVAAWRLYQKEAERALYQKTNGRSDVSGYVIHVL